MNSYTFLWIITTFGCLLTTGTSVHKVSTAQELINLFNTPTSVQDDISLMNDLDFTSTPLTFPLGTLSNGSCIPYSGKMEGNNHIIKGIYMNNTENTVYKYSALFCGLENATVKNFVIDSSCSFTGVYAGSIAVSAIGSVTLRKITNKASVIGKRSAGGLIGTVQYNGQGNPTIAIEGCTNNGNVIGSDGVGGFIGALNNNIYTHVKISDGVNNGHITDGDDVGGCIGDISHNTFLDVEILSFTNNGNIEGEYSLGGIFGYLLENADIKVSISNSINNGMIAGRYYLGGIIGDLERNKNMTTTIFNTVNNGFIDGEDGDTIGGFIGDVYDTNNGTLEISNSVNDGLINSTDFVGGFCGHVDTNEESGFNFNVVIKNCMNKGSVSATDGMSCGFICVDPEYFNLVSTTVLNSVNKGRIIGMTNASGIINNVTNALNIVSMGEVNGTKDTYAFWAGSVDVFSVYALKTI